MDVRSTIVCAAGAAALILSGPASPRPFAGDGLPGHFVGAETGVPVEFSPVKLPDVVVGPLNDDPRLVGPWAPLFAELATGHVVVTEDVQLRNIWRRCFDVPYDPTLVGLRSVIPRRRRQRPHPSLFRLLDHERRGDQSRVHRSRDLPGYVLRGRSRGRRDDRASGSPAPGHGSDLSLRRGRGGTRAPRAPDRQPPDRRPSDSQRPVAFRERPMPAHVIVRTVLGVLALALRRLQRREDARSDARGGQPRRPRVRRSAHRVGRQRQRFESLRLDTP